MYRLIKAEKRRFDRPIIIKQYEVCKNIKELQDIMIARLIEYHEREDKEEYVAMFPDVVRPWALKIINAIDNQERYIKLSDDYGAYLDYDKLLGFIGFSTDCSSSNEYIGESCKIIEVEFRGCPCYHDEHSN